MDIYFQQLNTFFHDMTINYYKRFNEGMNFCQNIYPRLFRGPFSAVHIVITITHSYVHIKPLLTSAVH